ncbi:MAG: GAF domain-containing protein [Hymenobacteraceae bacterium]|nr:GAF domain-containing protein [Hymenobacteraceae bacterium]
MEHTAAPINVHIDKNYDSEFCGSIPLHLVNLIQPHGVLLVLDREELRIRQASENVEQFLSVTLDDLLDQPLSAYLPAGQYEDILAKLKQQSSQEKIPFNLTFLVQGREVPFVALVHPEEEYLLIELEQNHAASEASFIGLYQHIKYVTTLLKQTGSVQDLAALAATEIKKLSGFDRVLIYQFDPQWNGIVVAQAKEEDMDDYMDLRFPASDVPKQARDLYHRNPYRLIPTRSYTPVRLIPIVNPITQRFTGLSDCNLRSVASVHLEYMANMHIMASMSLPLIIDGKLWGLISCHHKTEKNPSYEMRSVLELLSGIISAQIAGKEKEKAILLRVQLRGIHAKLLEQLYSGQSFPECLLHGETTIQELLSLGGVAVIYEGAVFRGGNTPRDRELKELASWLRRNNMDQHFATDKLPQQYVQSKEYKDIASGLIALPINVEHGEYILGFRPEVLQTVTWGGDPNNAIQMEQDGKTYHPRNSFATYRETVKHTSLPWHAEEIEAAEALRSAVLEKVIREKY